MLDSKYSAKSLLDPARIASTTGSIESENAGDPKRSNTKIVIEEKSLNKNIFFAIQKLSQK
jgi:hypothetical protein